MIRVWSTQKADTLLKLVTLRLEDFKLIWNDIMAITTDGVGIMLKLGRLVQCEHIVCLSQTLHLLAGLAAETSSTKNAAVELCRVQNVRV